MDTAKEEYPDCTFKDRAKFIIVDGGNQSLLPIRLKYKINMDQKRDYLLEYHPPETMTDEY